MKAIKRDSFIFYRSFYNAISQCPEKVQVELLRALAGYALDQEPPRFSDCAERPFMAAIWESIKPQIDANLQRFLNGCKGGAPIGNKNAKKTTKNNQKQPNENEYVNEYDNELTLPYKSREFLDTWRELKRQPKWKSKTKAALSRALSQLSKYPEGFAIELMNNAIINGYQGLVYSTTPAMFEQWQRSRKAEPAAPSKVITKVEDLM